MQGSTTGPFFGRFDHRDDEASRFRTGVNPRCPVDSVGVPSWRGERIAIGRNAACLRPHRIADRTHGTTAVSSERSGDPESRRQRPPRPVRVVSMSVAESPLGIDCEATASTLGLMRALPIGRDIARGSTPTGRQATDTVEERLLDDRSLVGFAFSGARQAIDGPIARAVDSDSRASRHH